MLQPQLRMMTDAYECYDIVIVFTFDLTRRVTPPVMLTMNFCLLRRCRCVNLYQRRRRPPQRRFRLLVADVASRRGLRTGRTRPRAWRGFGVRLRRASATGRDAGAYDLVASSLIASPPESLSSTGRAAAACASIFRIL